MTTNERLRVVDESDEKSIGYRVIDAEGKTLCVHRHALIGTKPPEPVGRVVKASDFPGAGFNAGDQLDYDAMNIWAERYGWRCRFRPHRWRQVDIYYPPETDKKCGP